MRRLIVPLAVLALTGVGCSVTYGTDASGPPPARGT